MRDTNFNDWKVHKTCERVVTMLATVQSFGGGNEILVLVNLYTLFMNVHVRSVETLLIIQVGI